DAALHSVRLRSRGSRDASRRTEPPAGRRYRSHLRTWHSQHRLGCHF
ncbi:MAG: hypothetical protein AVDCRST_MAG44-767, partial [uncultured Sphingomonas sp.]